MSLALVWFQKEVRSQCSMLLAYLGITFAAIAGMFLMRSGHFEAQGGAEQVVAIFVVAALLGVVVFAAPQAVRGELVGTRDQFLQRLPGALAPAFVGKLAFLVAAAVALPLLGWLVGVLYVGALGHSTVALVDIPGQFTNGNTLVAGVVALLELVPWVFALTFWMPGARMALGATVVLIVAISLAVYGVLQSSPGLADTLPWQTWAWWLVPLSVAVAWVSGVPGRRGGDHRRSARCGAATLIVGLMPPMAWLGTQVHAFHFPDLAEPRLLHVQGLSPDLRFAVGCAAANPRWSTVPVRIDLAQGTIEQVGGVHAGFAGPGLSRMDEGRRELFALWDRDECALLDLGTGERHAVGLDHARVPQIPAHLVARMRADARRTAPYLVPGNGRAWIAAGTLFVEDRDGAVSEQPWAAVGPSAAGDGIVVARRGEQRRLFDLRQRAFVGPAGFSGNAFSVGGVWFLRSTHPGSGPWQRLEGDGALTPTALSPSARWLAVLDDRSALIVRSTGVEPPGLFRYRTDTDALETVTLPTACREPATTLWSAQAWASARLDDPARRVWLTCVRSRRPTVLSLLAFHPADGTCREVAQGDLRVLALDGADHALVLEAQRRIVRLDLRSGEGTVLFPRGE